mgnify:CR=1 FL=1
MAARRGSPAARRGVTKEVRSGCGERGVKCNILILSGLYKRGVSKTDTPLLRNRLCFNTLHFTLEIGSGARVLGKGGGADEEQWPWGGRGATNHMGKGLLCTRSAFG